MYKRITLSRVCGNEQRERAWDHFLRSQSMSYGQGGTQARPLRLDIHESDALRAGVGCQLEPQDGVLKAAA
jgi:hypothetical protein